MKGLKILHSKIHNVKVTEANLNYVGSITIDSEIMEEADLLPWQEVFIVNNNNGARFETYVIPGAKGSRKICLNGSAARQVQVGDEIIVMNYRLIDLSNPAVKIHYRDNHHPRVVMLTESGVITSFKAHGEDGPNFITE